MASGKVSRWDGVEVLVGCNPRRHSRRILVVAALATALAAAPALAPPPALASASTLTAAASVRAGSTVSTRVRTEVALPAVWKVRTKGQIKITRSHGVTRCTKSGWHASKVAGRRAYVAMALTCTVPADGVARSVTLVNGKRRSQRLNIHVVLATPTTTTTPPATPAIPATPADEQAAVAPPAPALGGAGDFTFLATQPSDPARPVTWDRCQPIDVAVNLGPAPADEQALVTEAIRQVAVASGLPLQYSGATAHVPSAGTGEWPSGVEIVFAMSRAGESSLLDGSQAGSGGLTYSGPGHGLMWAVSGQVVIDWQVTSPLPGGATGFRTSIYMHELAHAIGLGHATGADQLMAPMLSEQNVGRWGVGDLAGLASLGSQGCRAA